MRAFATFYTNQIQSLFEYRFSMVVWLVGGIISTLLLSVLWLISAPESDGSIGGFSQNQLITYAWFSFLLQQIIGWYPFYEVQKEIKEGTITNYLLKPISIWQRYMAEEAAYHTLSVFMQLAGFFLLGIILRPYLTAMITLDSLLLLIPTFVGAMLILFNLQICMAQLAFWVTDTGPLQALFWISISILGGQWLPNGLLPDSVSGLNQLLPFRYTFAFPLEIMLGQLDQSTYLMGLVIQLGWVIVLFGLYRWLWKAGIKNYEAIGR
jgi:ABC-2 type transport system permease protein